MNPIIVMSRFIENHPNAYYSLIAAILFAMNFFFRWRNGDDWMDIWAFSLGYTAIFSGGLICADRQRRKKQEERQERERRLKEKEQMEEQE